MKSKKATELLFRLDKDRLNALNESVTTPQTEMYAHLTEWQGRINRWETDRKKAEAEHIQYWEEWATQLVDTTLESDLGTLDGLLGKLNESHESDQSAAFVNVGT